jgi:hypothetical protein
MLTIDGVLNACRAYEERFGRKPRYASLAAEDWAPVQHLLRDHIDAGGKIVASRYTLTIRVDGAAMPGAFMVSHKVAPARAKLKSIKALAHRLFGARLRPGGVTVQN